MDEEDLLLETPGAIDIGNLSELDESAILGEDDILEEEVVKDERHQSQNDTKGKEEGNQNLVTSSSSNSVVPANKPQARVAKAETKVPKEMQQLPDSTTASSTRAPKVFINPHHKGVIRPQSNCKRISLIFA
ncbi:unnamed protein product [Gongylonema pulchrum]|uniref:RAD51_interact domain-containing protein n=1 Tax=Gongylonema pulchrum TaxID=637853 RepID=A0A183E8B7_9BILA|nr:unnamed protein product [Gongylonema pulchrum]